MAPVIELSDVSKSYGDVVGIDGVSLSVDRGEIFGFLGKNGAGKTTAIRLLMQLLRPDMGRLALFGTSLASPHPELHGRIGYLPGDFRPYPDMTGIQYLEYMARYRARPPVLRLSLLDQLGVDSKGLRRPIKYLSHGNRQKLGLVLALEHDPELAILDEPTLGLDPLVQASLHEVLRGLRDRGTTLFFSSHLLAEVEKICTRVGIVQAGRLVALESIDALRRKRPRRLILILPSDSTEPPDLPGTRLVTRDGQRCTYLINGDMATLLPLLASLPTQEFFLPEPDLEDVFMAYYRTEEA